MATDGVESAPRGDHNPVMSIVGSNRLAAPSGSLRRGLTLIELLVAVAIATIIVSIALPTYLDSTRKSRRSEAFAALADVQQRQERHRSNQPTYAVSLTDLRSATPPGLEMPSARTTNGLYDLSLSNVSATGYTAAAFGVAGAPQENDSRCRALAVRYTAGNVKYGAAATLAAIDWAAANSDPNRCWLR